MTIIGISVGDIIAVIQLLKDIADTFDEHAGAQSHYQRTIRNLETIQALLSRLETFRSTSGYTSQVNAICAQAQAIHSDVQVFIGKVQKFQPNLGMGAPSGKRHGIIDKIQWSRKHAKKAAKLSDNIDVQLRNIQVLLDLDLSERSDLALQHYQDTADDLSTLPTRHELLASTSETVSRVETRVDQAEATLIQRLNQLERKTREYSKNAKVHDIQDLRAYIDARLPSTIRSDIDTASARLNLILTIPQLHLSRTDVALLFGKLSNELEFILKSFAIWLKGVLTFLVLLAPQLVLLQRTLRRLPAAISLALNDNMSFEDALGRLHSLQFQHFRHWRVFESSLQCIFEGTPGLEKIRKSHFILTPDKQPLATLTAVNYAAMVRPGYGFKMSMAMKKLITNASRCPKGCNGRVEKLSSLEHRCKICDLRYFDYLLGSTPLTDGGIESGTIRQKIHFLKTIQP